MQDTLLYTPGSTNSSLARKPSILMVFTKKDGDFRWIDLDRLFVASLEVPTAEQHFLSYEWSYTPLFYIYILDVAPSQ